MKVSAVLFTLFASLALAAPVAQPVAAPLALPEADALALRNAGLDFDIIAEANAHLTARELEARALDIGSVLTPLLQNLGTPSALITQVVEVLNQLVANNGIIPTGITTQLNIIPAALSADEIEVIGSALKQVLAGTLNTTGLDGLVDTVTSGLEKVLGTTPSSTTSASTATTTSVGTGAITLVDSLTALIKTYTPKSNTPSQTAAQLNGITSQLTTILSGLTGDSAGLKNVAVGPLVTSIGALIQALVGYIASVPVIQQILLVLQTGGLLQALLSLVSKLTGVAGFSTELASNINSTVTTTSGLGAGTLNNLVNNVVRTLVNILGGRDDGIAGLLGNLLKGLNIGGISGLLNGAN